jgi:hypothetical protein
MPLFSVKTLKVAAGSTIGFAASYMADSRKEEQDFSDVRDLPQAVLNGDGIDFVDSSIQPLLCTMMGQLRLTCRRHPVS